jgi:hypothetical protein
MDFGVHEHKFPSGIFIRIDMSHHFPTLSVFTLLTCVNFSIGLQLHQYLEFNFNDSGWCLIIIIMVQLFLLIY